MKALEGAFNQEKALVGAFSVIVQPVVEPMDRFAALENILNPCHEVKRQKQRCSHINWVAATPPPDCVSEVFNKHVLQTLRKSQSQIYTNK